MPPVDRSAQELVAEIRSRQHLTQEGLARLLGVSFSTVNAWESGRSQPQSRHRRRLEQLVAGHQEPGDDGRPTVLCIDDSPVDLKDATTLVRQAAQVLGVDVSVVGENDAMRALLVLGRLRPRVALIDVAMPGLDGLALADRIAGLPELSEVTVVLITNERDEQVRRAAEQGSLLVLDKPLSIGEVGSALRHGGLHVPVSDAG